MCRALRRLVVLKCRIAVMLPPHSNLTTTIFEPVPEMSCRSSSTLQIGLSLLISCRGPHNERGVSLKCQKLLWRATIGRRVGYTGRSTEKPSLRLSMLRCDLHFYTSQLLWKTSKMTEDTRNLCYMQHGETDIDACCPEEMN